MFTLHPMMLTMVCEHFPPHSIRILSKACLVGSLIRSASFGWLEPSSAVEAAASDSLSPPESTAARDAFVSASTSRTRGATRSWAAETVWARSSGSSVDAGDGTDVAAEERMDVQGATGVAVAPPVCLDLSEEDGGVLASPKGLFSRKSKEICALLRMTSRSTMSTKEGSSPIEIDLNDKQEQTLFKDLRR